jgi:hypothetical protein
VRLSGEVWAEDSVLWLAGEWVCISHAKQQKKGECFMPNLSSGKDCDFGEPNRTLRRSLLMLGEEKTKEPGSQSLAPF